MLILAVAAAVKNLDEEKNVKEVELYLCKHMSGKRVPSRDCVCWFRHMIQKALANEHIERRTCELCTVGTKRVDGPKKNIRDLYTKVH